MKTKNTIPDDEWNRMSFSDRLRYNYFEDYKDRITDYLGHPFRANEIEKIHQAFEEGISPDEYVKMLGVEPIAINKKPDLIYTND